MRTIIRIIVLIIILVFPATVVTQDLPPEIQFLHPPTPMLPEIQVTLASVLLVIADYNIRYDDSTTFCRNLYGLTEFNTKTISICGRMDFSLKVQAILHEVLHVLYWQRGIYTGDAYEPQIEAKALKVYREIFGMEGYGIQTSPATQQSPASP